MNFLQFVGPLALCLLLSAAADGTKIPSSVIELNDRFLEVMDHGLWFVEFYAPWCAHCKQLMPIWEHMAHALADKQSPIRVGKLDCTRFSAVASTLHIHGYPTVIFFRNGNQIHYEGERRKEELLKFAEKCAGPVVDRIGSQTKFIELRKASDREPFFVFYDPAQRAELEGSDEHTLWRHYENVSESLFTEVNFYAVNDRKVMPERARPEGNRTMVLVIKDREHMATFMADDDHHSNEEDTEGSEPLRRWVGQQRWPLMPKIAGSNIHAIADSSEKLLVLVPVEGVERLNSSTASGSFFDMLKQTAAEARKDPELEAQFQFGWLEGNQLVNGIVMGTLPVPNLVVFNLSSYEYFVSDDQPDQMTARSVLLFLHSVRQGQVQAQGGRAWITRLRRMAYEITSNIYDMFRHQPILTVCLFGVPLAFFSIITYAICSADFSVDRDEIYSDEHDEVEDDEDEDEEDGDEHRRSEEDDDNGFTHLRPLEGTAEGDGHEKAD